MPAAGEHPADTTAVDAVLTASRSLIAGRMCDRLVCKGLIRRHRARADRRAVLVSITTAGRRVVDQATARRRALIAGILAKLPADTQRAVAWALRAFADVAGEMPDNQWLSPGRADEAGAARPRRPARSAASAKESR